MSGPPEASDDDTAVAVVGMAARVPGAPDLDTFWEALLAGHDLVTRSASGRGHGVVADHDRFDAAFFGIPAPQAWLLDPQYRVLLECCWEALEDAGRAPGTAIAEGTTGVFAGSGETDHLAALRAHRDRLPGTTDEQLRLAGSRDLLTGRLAYQLDLRGPAVTVHTACSTSLVAVHLAIQSLLAGDCDTALAGGVALRPATDADDPDTDGDLIAPDGRCRPFDADAAGMVGADGAGIVVLRRLVDALADGDPVHAVVRGSAVSNDGAAKVGFTAPGVAGQVAAIRAAHLLAGVAPEEIAYVEAHGTGTAIGDTIEVRALSEGFGAGARQRCLLSSVKSNIGHSDVAAGVLGLIKVILALRNGILPGTAHFRRPHPHLDLPSTPFAVTAAATPWPPGPTVRRAGVHATGIGGTNAHVVVEEAPPAPPRPGDDRPHLLPLSARTPAALTEMTGRLRDHLRDEPVAVADVAWTLQTGRSAFEHRAYVVCRDRESGVAALDDLLAGRPAATADAGLREVGERWRAGAGVDWPAPAPGTRRVPLPTYPFKRERFALDAAPPEPAPPARSAAPPRATALEETIAGVWSEVLRVPHVGVDDDFFDLGGHSLHATRLLTRLRQALGDDLAPLTVMDLFDGPTVRELAALVGEPQGRPPEDAP